jgi:hypothetical protein
MPGRLNTVSVMMAPPMRAPRSMPAMVMTGMTAFLKPWPQITLRSLRPFARAVRMKSERLTSSIEARCM